MHFLEDQNTIKSVKKSTTTSQTPRRDHSNMKGQEHNCLELSTKIAVLNFATDHPRIWYWKNADPNNVKK